MSGGQALNDEAREALDSYLRDRERKAEEALKARERAYADALRDSDAVLSKRWRDLILFNLVAIVGGAGAVLSVAYSSAQSAAVAAINDTDGLISQMVSKQVTTISDNLDKSSRAVGRLEEIRAKLSSRVRESEAELAQASTQARAQLLQLDEVTEKTRTLIETRQAETEMELERSFDDFKGEIGRLVRDGVDRERVRLEGLASRVGALTTKIGGLEGDDLGALEQKVERWRAIDEALSDQDAAATLARHGVEISRLAKAAIPPGTIGISTGGVPPGWELCDGRPVSSTDSKYAALAEVIAQTWGTGTDGAGDPVQGCDLNLPNLVGRVLVGAAPEPAVDADGVRSVGELWGAPTMRLTKQELPSHSHTATDRGHSHGLAYSMQEGVKYEHRDRADFGPVWELLNQPNKKKQAVRNGKANISVGSTGNGESFSIEQPSAGILYIVKL